MQSAFCYSRAWLPREESRIIFACVTLQNADRALLRAFEQCFADVNQNRSGIPRAPDK
jgi:hypothetical protein